MQDVDVCGILFNQLIFIVNVIARIILFCDASEFVRSS